MMTVQTARFAAEAPGIEEPRPAVSGREGTPQGDPTPSIGRSSPAHRSPVV